MEDIYSIGETAKINDVSIKSLRHYDEIGLLKPRYTDPNNGYRYYTYDQFSFIDKIKRYKSIGMPLKDLKEIFQTKDLSLIESFLRQQEKNLEEEQRILEEKKQNVKWLKEFFEYSKTLQTTEDIYIKHIGKRKMLSVPCLGSDSMYAMDMELRRVIALPEHKALQVLNPYGYILDFDRLLENEFYPTHSTVSVSGVPERESTYFVTIPEGDYVCCQSQILSDGFDLSFFKKYCGEHNLRFDFVIACEYLKSLYDPANSPYEIQALLVRAE